MLDEHMKARILNQILSHSGTCHGIHRVVSVFEPLDRLKATVSSPDPYEGRVGTLLGQAIAKAREEQG
jgi:hypothetical protein